MGLTVLGAVRRCVASAVRQCSELSEGGAYSPSTPPNTAILESWRIDVGF